MEDACARSFGLVTHPLPTFLTEEDAKAWYDARRDRAPKMAHLFRTLCTWAEIERELLPHIRKLGVPVVRSCSGQTDPHADKIMEDADVYQRLPWNPDAVLNTLRYLFFHCRCGIFVSVRKGRVAAFVPFANKSYTNTWSEKVVCGRGDETIEQYISRKAAANRCREEIWLPPSAWWMNGGIVCNVMPDMYWGDAHCAALFDMLCASCASREVPDVDFFVNKRDFPQLKRDGSDPYGRFTGSYRLPREAYATYAPVLSFYTGSTIADLPLPLSEDWVIASGKSFPGGPYLGARRSAVSFACKQPRAVFRGTATGPMHDNQRIALVRHTSVRPDLVDAGITGYASKRDRIVSASDTKIVVDFMEPQLPRCPFMSMQEQFDTFRYVLYVDGHAAASRFGTLLHSGCVVLRVESKRNTETGHLWLFSRTKGFKLVRGGSTDIPEGTDHFLIDATMDNLFYTIEWLNDHIDICAAVLEACARVAPSIDSICDCVSQTLWSVHNKSAQAFGGSGKSWFSTADPEYCALGTTAGSWTTTMR